MSNDSAANSANSQASSRAHVQTTVILLLLLLYRLATIRLLVLVIAAIALRRWRTLLITAILLLISTMFTTTAIAIAGGTTVTVLGRIRTVAVTARLLAGLTTGGKPVLLKAGGFPLRAACRILNVVPSLILVVPLRGPARGQGRLVRGRAVRRRWTGAVVGNRSAGTGRGSVAWLLRGVLSLVAGLRGWRVLVAAAVVRGLRLRRLRGVWLLRRLLLLRRGVVIARA